MSTVGRPTLPITVEGPALFARFAYPPNALGYCGPEDSLGLLEYAAAGVSDGGLRALARGFEGAWPYLELIAGASGITDPLSAPVVEAYWIGNRLLDRVDAGLFARFLDDWFGKRAGRDGRELAAAAIAGGVPHHNFHVFAVYPWVGLMRAGRVAEPLAVLERCRIRWGEVERVDGDQAQVRSRRLWWDGQRLTLGPTRLETVTASVGGRGLATRIRTGDQVALHWDWICDRLSPARASALRRHTRRAFDVVNGVDRSPVTVFE